MGKKGINLVYLKLDDNGAFSKGKIDSKSLLGGDPLSSEVYFEFEKVYRPHTKFLAPGASLPVNDVIISRRVKDGCITPVRPLEVKLTALPDSATASKKSDLWSCELVVRQPTIKSLALSYISKPGATQELFQPFVGITEKANWSEAITDKNMAVKSIKELQVEVDKLLTHFNQHGEPLLLQPIWKTEGQSSRLGENCFDVFVWSDNAFAKMISERAASSPLYKGFLSRPARSLVWLSAILGQYGKDGKVNPDLAISQNLAGAKTDKAFAMNGTQTHPYLNSPHLLKPRVQKSALKDIIQGAGEKHLKPERRLDAAIGITADQENLFGS